MKKICCLAVFQIVMGCAIAAYCLFFNVSKFRQQELAVGENLLQYSRSIDDNKKLVEVSADSFFKISKSLNAIAKCCDVIAEKTKTVFFAKKFTPLIKKLRISLVEQAQVIDESQQNFPKTLSALDSTRDNLNNLGNMLVKESPVNQISIHIKFAGLALSAMMIINGIAFLIIAREKKCVNENNN